MHGKSITVRPVTRHQGANAERSANSNQVRKQTDLTAELVIGAAAKQMHNRDQDHRAESGCGQ
jgi:hypothetical protein